MTVVVAALLAAAMSALATIGTVAVLDVADDVDARPLPTTLAELEEQVAARLPEPADGDWSRTVVLTERADGTGAGEAMLAVPPGRYAVHVVCGLMSGQYIETKEVVLNIRGNMTPESPRVATLPCPSTALTFDTELVFAEPGAIGVQTESHRIPTGAVAFMITGTPADDGSAN